MGRSARLIRRRRRRLPADSGAVAVEFALILPVFLLLVFAMIDFGRMLNAQITLSEAAREGARTGAVTRSETQGEARALSIARTALGAPGIRADVNPCRPGYDAGAEANAVVTYDFRYVTPLGALIGRSGGARLTGRSVMPCLH